MRQTQKRLSKRKALSDLLLACKHHWFLSNCLAPAHICEQAACIPQLSWGGFAPSRCKQQSGVCLCRLCSAHSSLDCSVAHAHLYGVEQVLRRIVLLPLLLGDEVR